MGDLHSYSDVYAILEKYRILCFLRHITMDIKSPPKNIFQKTQEIVKA
jgi:hypothetical protein